MILKIDSFVDSVFSPKNVLQKLFFFLLGFYRNFDMW
jgi:hypothetical protein